MSRPTIKDLQAELMSLKVRHRAIEQENNAVKSDCADLQQKLNMANATVAELMKEIEDLNKLITDANTDKIKHFNKVGELSAENEKLKKELWLNSNMSSKVLEDENTKLKSDYAELEEKYYTQADNYTELNKMHDDLLSKFNKNLDQHRAIEAENQALKAGVEHYKDVIETKRAEIKRFVEAENQLHKEQQPTVINYHNCTFNN